VTTRGIGADADNEDEVLDVDSLDDPFTKPDAATAGAPELFPELEELLQTAPEARTGPEVESEADLECHQHGVHAQLVAAEQRCQKLVSSLTNIAARLASRRKSGSPTRIGALSKEHQACGRQGALSEPIDPVVPVSFQQTSSHAEALQQQLDHEPSMSCSEAHAKSRASRDEVLESTEDPSEVQTDSIKTSPNTNEFFDYELLVSHELCMSSPEATVESNEDAQSRSLKDSSESVDSGVLVSSPEHDSEVLVSSPEEVVQSKSQDQSNGSEPDSDELPALYNMVSSSSELPEGSHSAPSDRLEGDFFRQVDYNLSASGEQQTNPVAVSNLVRTLFVEAESTSTAESYELGDDKRPAFLNIPTSSSELQEGNSTAPSERLQADNSRVTACKLSVSYAQQTLTLRWGHEDAVCPSKQVLSSKSQAQSNDILEEESGEPGDDNLAAQWDMTTFVSEPQPWSDLAFQNGSGHRKRFSIVPMGQMCPTAAFLNQRGWRTKSLPLDWCCATFKVWDHMLHDGFSTLLPTKPLIKGKKCVHPYDLQFQDTLMFLHHAGWANDWKVRATMNKRVERLKSILRTRHAFGLSFYYEGKENVHQTLAELVADATKLAQPTRGFAHIVLVWFNQVERYQPKWTWSRVNPYLTLLRYTPKRQMGWGLDLHPVDSVCLDQILRERFPIVFSKAATDEQSEPSLSAEEDGDQYAGNDINWNLAWDFDRGQLRL